MPVRLWTPLAVAVYGLFGFPSAIFPAVINWWALGRKKKALLHLAVGFVLMMFVVVLLAILPKGVRHLLAMVLNAGTFFYVKASLQSDIDALEAADPDVVIQDRSWYSALGWALLGMLTLGLMGALLTVLMVVVYRLVPA